MIMRGNYWPVAAIIVLSGGILWAATESAHYRIPVSAVNAGAGSAISNSYKTMQVSGQTAIGAAGSASYKLKAGTLYPQFTGSVLQLSQNFSFVQSSSVVIGDQAVQQFTSTSAVKLDFNGIAFTLSSNVPVGVIAQSDKIVLYSTFSAPVIFGNQINFQVPPNTKVAVATTAAGAFVFNSTASQAAVSFGGNRINFKLPPGLDTTVKENAGILVLQASAAAKFQYGNSLAITLPGQVTMQMSTAASVFASGTLLLSSAQFTLGIGSGSVLIPPAQGLDFEEKSSGKVVLRSTMASVNPIQWGGSVSLALPASIHAELTSLSSSTFILTSTAPVPLSVAGMAVFPSSGSFQAKDLENVFSVILQTDTAASCSLTLPTTAQKTLEVGLVRRGGSSGAVSLQIVPGALSQNVTMDVKLPSSIPSTTRSASGSSVFGLGNDLAIEITPAQSVNVSNSTGVPVSFAYQDADLGGRSGTSLRVGVYNPSSASWEILTTVVDANARTATAYAPHFSLYQLMSVEPLASPSLSVKEAKAYPNPFLPAKGHTSVTLANLPEGAKIKIYTLSGVLVRELTSNSSGLAFWDGKNDSGENAASGVYFTFIEGAGGKKTLKVAIQR